MARKYGSVRNHKNKRVNSSNIVAIFIFVVSFLIIGGFGYLYLAATKQHEEFDDCRKGTPKAITAILIDHTDNINPKQKEALENRLLSIAKSVPKNSLIKIYSVNNSAKKILEPEKALCNPGSGTDVSDITGNKKLADKRYEEEFKKPIKNILDRIVSAGSSKESPIMESLQSVAVTSFVGNDGSVVKKKLILVSDLLENTEKFNLYKEVPDFEIFKSSPHWWYVKADLSDVDVEIYILRRYGHDEVKNDKLLSFWKKFFVNQKANSINTVPIEG